MRSSSLLLLTLTACSGDYFTGISEGGLPEGDSSSESSTDVDSGTNPGDGSGLDARETGDNASTDAGADAKPDGPCPTGFAACDDAITAWCSRMAACCNGQCLYAWQNAGGSQCAAVLSTGGCSGKMICENACLADIQSASCTTIKGTPSPPYVASSCMSLWQ
jgi:hypothetical protein